MKRRQLLTILPLLVLLGLASCNSADPSHIVATWRLESFAVDDTVQLAEPGVTATREVVLDFSTDTFWGYAGCNFTIGRFELDREVLVPNSVVSTEMGCFTEQPGFDLMAAETSLEDVFRNNPTGFAVVISDDEMTWRSETQTLVFSRQSGQGVHR